MLRALVDSRAFARSAGAKVRDPGEDLVATYRALGVRSAQPPDGEAGDAYAANQLLWQVASIGIEALRLAATRRSADRQRRPGRRPRGWSPRCRCTSTWPAAGGRRRARSTAQPASWLPSTSVRFDDLVDHVSQIVLHRRATSRLVRACCQATGVKPQRADHRRPRAGALGHVPAPVHPARLPRPPDPVTR